MQQNARTLGDGYRRRRRRRRHSIAAHPPAAALSERPAVQVYNGLIYDEAGGERPPASVLSFCCTPLCLKQAFRYRWRGGRGGAQNDRTLAGVYTLQAATTATR